MYPGRTTPTLVQAITLIDPTITDITPFCDIANELVTELCAVMGTSITVNGVTTTFPLPVNIYGYSDHRLLLIETWLAAHFYSIRDRMLSQDNAGPVGEQTPAVLGLGLKQTTYGQQARLLDTAGAMAVLENGMDKYSKIPLGLASGIQAGIDWLGKSMPWGNRRCW